MAGLRTKPSSYKPLSFHGIRTISLISSLIVSGIMIFFCIALKADGYKLPWTFVITMSASILSVIVLLLTTVIYCCTSLSPSFNLILNAPLLLLWLLGLSLLSWNMYETLEHSCDRTNWASNDGVMICQMYKAVFSFTVVGAISQIALVTVDIRARGDQRRFGRYNAMRGPTPEKSDDLQSLRAHHEPIALVEQAGWKQGQRAGRDMVSSDYQSPYVSARSPEYTGSHEPLRMQQFERYRGETSHYDPGDIGQVDHQSYFASQGSERGYRDHE